MKGRKKIQNAGYSLVELVIVICIIGILTAASFITLRSVDSAKYKKAVSTLESEMTTLRTSTMAQEACMAMKLYLGADGNYYIKRGYCDASGTFQPLSAIDSDGEATVPDSKPNLRGLSYYSYSGVSNPVRVLSRGSITYNGNPVTEAGVIIQYNKSDGSIDAANGAGEYCLYRRNGQLIANVHLVSVTGLYHETY